ncbi:ribonuclease H-like domain-containing protein [Neurospora tetraspora]|uniref:Ribonuclease H-like domain-containing protein n=1 Tax=Neurospora tetraspora TaxID=94610 RepID=A0AAE0MSD1_9PEZI|nr:ribonuclease H-like domain-containing protein [Neurospora tetraspora]
MASRQQSSHMAQPMGKAAMGRQVAEPIAASEEYMKYLTNLIPSTTELIKAGFVVTPLTKKELQTKVKCKKCNKKCTKTDRPPRDPSHAGDGSSNGSFANETTSTASNAGSSHTGHKRRHRSHGKPHDKGKQGDATSTNSKQEQPRIICKYHPGRIKNKTWTCCSLHVSQPPCSGAPTHTPLTYAPGALEARWLFVPTPPHPSSNPQAPQFRSAVAIDCEMGTSADLESELIRLSLIDYFSGQILIDSLVRPLVPMQHMNTRYSGVTRQDIQNAVRNGTCILGGLEEARREVWKFVGPETVVVGHSVRNDLVCLRWIHTRCVDSLLVEEGVRKEVKRREEVEWEEKMDGEISRMLVMAATKHGKNKSEFLDDEEEKINKKEEEEKKKRERRSREGMSLKALAEKKLGRVIQDGGKKGHDSVEDAVAARDLIHHHILGLMQNDKEEREEKARKEAEEKAKEAADDGPETWGAPPMNYCVSHFPAGWGI